jgi:hypothetical protein
VPSVTGVTSVIRIIDLPSVTGVTSVTKMDISRQLPPEVSSLAGESGFSREFFVRFELGILSKNSKYNC